MLLRIIIATIFMILGFSAVMIGFMMITAMPEPRPMGAGIALMAAGLITGIVCLWLILRGNRDAQEKALQEALAHPERILLRWNTDAGEVIFTRDSLFVGSKQHGLRLWYERFSRAEWEADGRKVTLYIRSEVAQTSGAERAVPLAVPPESEAALRELLLQLSTPADSKHP